jgi:protein TonB
MKMLALLASFALAAGVALADPAPNSRPSMPPLPADVMGPMPVGPTHNCGRFFPEQAMLDHDEGMVTVGFDIDAYGAVKNAVVLVSSGHESLDAAAIACVQQWHYKPASRKGTPIRVKWQAGVSFSLGRSLHDNPPPSPPSGTQAVPASQITWTEIDYSCMRHHYPHPELFNGVEGTTVVKFTVNTDGTVGNVVVSATSGSDGLDKAAIACVRSWTNQSAPQDGQAVGASRNAQIVWSIPSETPVLDYDAAKHGCDGTWSRGSGTVDVLGEAVLSFIVDAKGYVRAPKVATSSGVAAMDSELQQCVASWTYAPAMRNGTPIAIVWGIRARWTGGSYSIAEGPPYRHFCFPIQTGLSPHVSYTPTVLSFTVQKDGTVDGIVVSQPSGTASLNDDAIACAKEWRYPPPMAAGVPSTTPWRAQINWSAKMGPVVELGDGQPPG